MAPGGGRAGERHLDRGALPRARIGLALATRDGGASWQSLQERIDNRKQSHLYAVDARDDTVCIAGEQGIVLRSQDRGQTFARVDSPYRGSYFTVACDRDGRILAAGLNGNAWWSGDGGGHWQKVDTGARGSIVASRRASDRLLVADQSGQILVSSDAGRTFSPTAAAAQAPLSSFVPLSNRQVTVGLRGVAIAPHGAMQ